MLDWDPLTKRAETNLLLSVAALRFSRYLVPRPLCASSGSHHGVFWSLVSASTPFSRASSSRPVCISITLLGWLFSLLSISLFSHFTCHVGFGASCLGHTGHDRSLYPLMF
ncbi:hypothetical protein BU26DRAFT_216645 [Trematosphaeria pertusa]|uniref:Uncharacterized protein n=1 Tax=Trematosphaeria pertusa TaxID=390896 RepID=A0A6A6ISU6_9PLEO|nr:uncharacterized protein BU26DRAFT_216645 [Trematosphaeria pertusa]KAF2253167.1 hypothetical protein BU26DRAFT_216645 [Trematosphaeria pertusa]